MTAVPLDDDTLAAMQAEIDRLRTPQAATEAAIVLARQSGIGPQTALAMIQSTAGLLNERDELRVEVRRLREREAAAHVPTIAAKKPGEWGVFCLACSDAAGDYVFPCRAHPDVWTRQQYPAALGGVS